MVRKFRYENDYPIVDTTCGKVHGYEYDDVIYFKGIPYARAERFCDPKAYTWDGVFEATAYGYSCPTIEEPALDYSLDFARKQELKDEACQNLNIWTPALDNEKRPVLVWLHGGGMSFGSSSEDGLCEGDNMCRFGRVVVVSLNHRLNLLGFCDLSDFGEKFKNSGNQGIADMVFALKWIRDNIAKFGGDPDNVMLFGQSGGGMKVTALLQTPEADGLFHKGLIMSGVQGGAMCDCNGSGKKMGEILMEETGCSNIEELCKVPVKELLGAGKIVRKKLKFLGYNAGEMPFYSDYYLGDPLIHPFRSETAHIPLLVGSTFGEFNAPFSYGISKHRMTDKEMEDKIKETLGEDLASKVIPLFKEAYPERPLVDVLSMDYMFRSYIRSYMKRRTELNDCTWEYIFNLDMPMLGGVSPLHGNDLGFVFNTTDRAPALQEPGVTEKVQKEVFDTVMAFAKTGNPNNGSIPAWEPSKPGDFKALVFGKETAVRRNFDAELNDCMAGELLEKQVQFMYDSVSGRIGG